MSRFYGDLRGQAKTQATRRGSRKSGLDAHIRGWNIGVKIRCFDQDGSDVITVHLTGGSNSPSSSHCLAEISDSTDIIESTEL